MRNIDLLIIGGGPAGLSAGIEAAKLGVKVLLIDDKHDLGGQLVKQTHMFFGSKYEGAGKRGITIATEMVDEYLSAGGEVITEAMAVGSFEDGVVTVLVKNKDYILLHPKKIVVAGGAYENMLAFPGCDLPGVYGAGGFQTLMNVSGVLPGKKVLMVGSGNIGLIVSYQLMQAGGRVAALVEAAPRIGGYQVHAAKIQRMAVPIHLSHTIKCVNGKDRVESATLIKLDKNFKEIPNSEFTIEVDAVCLSVGLSPLSEFFFEARCKMISIPELGGWIPSHDEDMRTSNPDIFVAGDSSGIEEASAAMVEGKIAGCTVAGDILDKDFSELRNEHQAQLKLLRTGPFGAKARSGKGKLWNKDLSEPHTQIDDNSITKNEQAVNGKKIIIECTQHIPCNPCEAACPTGAIVIGDDITKPPEIDYEKCTSCGICMMRCPGLAIFMVNMDHSDNQVEITIPYELYDKPQKGDSYFAYGKQGNFISMVTITKVRTAKSFDKKQLLSFTIDKKYANDARHIRKEKAPELTFTNSDQSDNDPIICRCEDVRLSKIEQLIDDGYHSFNEIKRITRTGMGPCQGKTCQRLIQQIITSKTGIPAAEQIPMTVRSPLKPVSFAVLANAELPGDNNE